MFCGQCGKSIDDDSLYCRFCGGKQRPGAAGSDSAVIVPSTEVEPPSQAAEPGAFPLAAKIALGVVAAIVLLVVAAIALPPSQQVPGAADLNVTDPMTSVDTADPLNELGIAPSPATPEQPWSYSTDEDKVRGGTSYFARTTSTNSVNLDAPYDGGSTLSLTVRKSPANGTDVIVRLSSGQLMCPSYEGCYGTVRFDNGAAQRVNFSGASDNSSDTVFVDDAENFIAQLKKAKKAILEIEIYQAGRPQFEFDVRGLKWDHSRPEKVPVDDAPDDNSTEFD
jgi:hypothetical protein